MTVSNEKARQLADQLHRISNQLYDYPYLNFAIQLDGVHMRLVEEIWRQEERSRTTKGNAA